MRNEPKKITTFHVVDGNYNIFLYNKKQDLYFGGFGGLYAKWVERSKAIIFKDKIQAVNFSSVFGCVKKYKRNDRKKTDNN